MSGKRRWVLGGVGVVVVLASVIGGPMAHQALKVGTGYAAKRLCSEVFLANRDPGEVQAVDLGFLPVPVSMSVDRDKKTATATALGLVSQVGAWRSGLGCALTNGSSVEAVQKMGFVPKAEAPLSTQTPWPHGEGAPEVDAAVDAKKLEEALNFAFAEPDPESLRRTRAVVIIRDGKLIAERYAKGFSAKTPLLSWSMGKSITSTLVGRMVKLRGLDIQTTPKVPEWDTSDPRSKITWDQFLRMSSALAFSEDYGAFGDATRMLFTSRGSAEVAAQAPLGGEPGSVWSYSSGDTNLLSRAIRLELGDDAVYHKFPHKELFARIGIRSATFETDPSGTFVGSSFVYMTARDWARFGQLYLQKGRWSGEALLPDGWVDYSCTPTPGAPLGEYGAQWWLNAGAKGDAANRSYPNVPTDMCAAQGFETQRVMVFPKDKLVIVRLGLTRKRGAFDTDAFVSRVLRAMPQNP